MRYNKTYCLLLYWFILLCLHVILLYLNVNFIVWMCISYTYLLIVIYRVKTFLVDEINIYNLDQLVIYLPNWAARFYIHFTEFKFMIVLHPLIRFCHLYYRLSENVYHVLDRSSKFTTSGSSDNQKTITTGSDINNSFLSSEQ